MDLLSIIAVSIGPLIVFSMIMVGIIQSNRSDITENWVKYRCNPIYMPFTFMFSDVSTTENLQYCVNGYAQNIFETLTQPIHLMFSIFVKIIAGVTESLDQFRGFTTGIQNFILSYANDFFGKLGNSVGAIVAIMNRIRDLSQRIIASAGYTAVIASTSVQFITSVIDFTMTLLRSLVGIIFGLGVLLSIVFPPLLFFFIPIGASLGMTYSCFHPNTRIHMADGTHMLLKDVRVGDELLSGVVTAVMRFDATDIPLYEYNNVIVAGEHLVKEDGEWKHVKDAKHVYMFLGEQPTEIICLNTSTHEIVINGTTFSDYEEIDDEPPSFVPLSPDDTIDGIPLKETYPGLETQYGKIMGVVYLEHGKMQLFIENEYSGMFLINGGTLVKDYPDSHDPVVLKEIQQRVLQKLNRKT